MNNKAWMLAAVLMTACHKENEVRPNEPTAPVTRPMYVDMGNMTPDQLGVVLWRPTHGSVTHGWEQVDPVWHILVTQPNANVANAYRNDVLTFIGNVTESTTITYRLDDLSPVTVTIEPADNGSPGYTTTLNW